MFLGDSCVDAIPAHELLHVLGRYHEQARPDRDQYVVIHSQNFDSSKSHVATNSTTADHDCLHAWPSKFLC